MKTLFLIPLIVIISACMYAQPGVHCDRNQTGTLVVLIKGLKNTEGSLRVALFNSADQFMGDVVYEGTVVKISNGEMLVKFEEIPFGDYAIAVIHDEDNDGQLDKNVLGIPTEGYGFSNHAMGKYGPPKWLQASFFMDKRSQASIVELAYGLPK
jgi:uncharacterized protein (DUF2141 family)